jgi:hypothetical protein
MAVILGILILIGTVVFAVFAEFARGMAAAPSMHESYFVVIMAVGVPIAFLVAATHWLGW